MENIKKYVTNNSNLLFKHIENNTLIALFDNKGFKFNNDAQIAYDNIKNHPHLYVAWTNTQNGFFYVGKSFQQGGRWKRSHAYHLGTLAYHLLDTLQDDDQNHQHWIDSWMDIEKLKKGNDNHKIHLINEVNICFIPFDIYSDTKYESLGKNQIRTINSQAETALILSYKNEGKRLLNVQNNNSTFQTKKKISISKKNVSQDKSAIKAKQNEGALNSNKCIEFKVIQNQKIPDIAGDIANLPVGVCTIQIWESSNRKPVYPPIRKVRTAGKTVMEYFNAPDTNRGNIPKWKVVQNEMLKNNIKEVTVRVCPDSNGSIKVVVNTIKPRPIKVIKPFIKGASLIKIPKLYLVNCSKTKIPANQLGNHKFQIKKLSFPEINLLRTKLFSIIKKNCVINSNKSDLAHKVYSPGRLFNAADSIKWSKDQSKRVYIMSALFGIIRADDYIPFYDLALTDEINGCKNFAQKYWKGKLDAVLEKIVKNEGLIINLLSTDYGKCVSNKNLELHNQKFKNDRNIDKGKWLKKQLMNI